MGIVWDCGTTHRRPPAHAEPEAVQNSRANMILGRGPPVKEMSQSKQATALPRVQGTSPGFAAWKVYGLGMRESDW